MCEPTTLGCPRVAAGYCDRCDLLVGLDGYHVTRVDVDGSGLVVTIESGPGPVGCPECGAVGVSHGRRTVAVIDAPCFGRPVRLRWRKRTWSCPGRAVGCQVGVFTEQDPGLVRPRGLLTVRACWWAIGQIRREHASVAGLARQLGCSWRTVWTSIRPLLQALDTDPARFDGVGRLGVDEHIVRHEALLFRMEVKDLHCLAVAAVE